MGARPQLIREVVRPHSALGDTTLRAQGIHPKVWTFASSKEAFREVTDWNLLDSPRDS